MTKIKALKVVRTDGFNIENMSKEEENAVLYLNDINNKVEQYKKYLDSTDWYYTRKLETGEDIPTEIVEKRKEAREFLRNQGY